MFEGDGVVKDFVGSYSEYREYIKEREKEKRALERAKEQKTTQKKEFQDNPVQPKKRKLSYKEQRELEQIERELEILGKERKVLEEELSGGELQGEQLQRASVRIGEVIALLDDKELRWLELNDN